ncbi:MAG TPA: lysylphosphatidylglycerol synthase transmembrane domain-containing protein [Candidatus Omnitrophota bacterium]|nr:lysylphosphatidylglycerol synthase transmembrane domain-containing protein [Candidatus Omnitrophota bacterium]HQO57284.1 lysylphosphatidylglycerol synthase transmembrane domain-containing protein [Candidatus Omnitrophota bacterium]HQP11303.1 lysylphosphatidylglycerol synthase transmembrane domain-containing protein [Candidatus Omnitrophota bacterium]
MVSQEKIKNLLVVVSRYVISGLLLIYLYNQIDVEKTAAIIQSADVGYMLLAFFIFILINGMILVRWIVYVRAFQIEVSWMRLTRFFSLGLFGNLFLPSAIGGDVIKTMGLCHKRGGKAKVVASVVLDRLSGFASMVIVSTLAYIAGYRLLKEASLLTIILATAGVSGAAAFILSNERIYSYCCRVFQVFPRLQRGLMNMHYDIVLLKDRYRTNLKAVFLSSIAQTSLSFVWFLLAKSLHQDIPLIYFLVFVPFTCFASTFPSVGGLGAREAAAVYLFAKVGVEPGISMSISLLNYLLMVLGGVLGGALYVLMKDPVADAPAVTPHIS